VPVVLCITNSIGWAFLASRSARFGRWNMEERVVIALAVVLIGLALYNLLKRWHVAQANHNGNLRVSRPTILYFQSDTCAACPTQSRFLEQLNGEWHGRVAIQKIDADQEPEIATQYHVFTLPTTILIDEVGQVREINYGLTNTHKLSKQVASLQVATAL
jgi:thiol-disulfide isomerase/thioredoxin